MRTLYLTISLLLTLSSIALADHVLLENGDRLTGRIVEFDGKNLILKSDLAGDVSLPWAAVQQITSDQQLHIQSTTGQTTVGRVTTSGDKLEITTRTTGTVEMTKESVALIRNEAEQSAYEESLHPGLRQNWDGGTTVGFALTRGNSQTKNLALAFNANRKTLHDRLGVYANSVYATNDALGAVPSTTANAELGGIRYDHDISPRLFGFVGADFQADSLQTLDLRSIFGGGLGFHMIKGDTTSLDLLAGANYTRETYTAFIRNFAAATLGDEFTHKLYGNTVLTQSLYFYPDVVHPSKLDIQGLGFS